MRRRSPNAVDVIATVVLVLSFILIAWGASHILESVFCQQVAEKTVSCRTPTVGQSASEPHPVRLVYSVHVYVDGKQVAVYGVDYRHLLDGMLSDIALRYAAPPLRWEEPEEEGRRLPGPRVEVSIWDHISEGGCWYHPGGKRMSADWSGRLPVKVVRNIGSYAIE